MTVGVDIQFVKLWTIVIYSTAQLLRSKNIIMSRLFMVVLAFLTNSMGNYGWRLNSFTMISSHIRFVTYGLFTYTIYICLRDVPNTQKQRGCRWSTDIGLDMALLTEEGLKALPPSNRTSWFVDCTFTKLVSERRCNHFSLLHQVGVADGHYCGGTLITDVAVLTSGLCLIMANQSDEKCHQVSPENTLRRRRSIQTVYILELDACVRRHLQIESIGNSEEKCFEMH